MVNPWLHPVRWWRTPPASLLSHPDGGGDPVHPWPARERRSLRYAASITIGSAVALLGCALAGEWIVASLALVTAAFAGGCWLALAWQLKWMTADPEFYEVKPLGRPGFPEGGPASVGRLLWTLTFGVVVLVFSAAMIAGTPTTVSGPLRPSWLLALVWSVPVFVHAVLVWRSTAPRAVRVDPDRVELLDGGAR